MTDSEMANLQAIMADHDRMLCYDQNPVCEIFKADGCTYIIHGTPRTHHITRSDRAQYSDFSVFTRDIMP